MNNYEHFRYLDQFLKMDNLKYHIARKEDIDDIKNLIDYVEGLVIKDYDEAEKYETLESSRSSILYINCYLGIDDKLSEFEKQTVINSYVEKNKYYIELKNDFNISYIDARLAKDYSIMKATTKSLNSADEILFNECYNLTLQYFINVLKNNAFIGEKLNKCYFREILVFFAIQKYITKKMERYWDVDNYSKYDCKNTFISTGIDYFDGLPLQYQRKLIKMLNTIIQYKGTDRCFDIILDAFGMENVQIYKYVLAKDWEENDLFFYKTKINDAVNTQTDYIARYEDVVEGDALWQADKEEILEKEFNCIDTKYISVDLATDILESTMSMSYLISLVYILENQYSDKKDGDAFKFTNKNISPNPIDMFDAIIATLILVCRRKGYSTVINRNLFSKEIKSIYGFDNLANNDNVREFLHDIKLHLIQHKYELTEERNFIELYDFFNSFTMESFEAKGLYTEADLKKIYLDDPIHFDELKRIAHYYNMTNIQDKIDENGDRLEHRLVDILDFLSERILLRKPDIVDFKKHFPNTYLLVGKYNIYNSREGLGLTYDLERALSNDKLFKQELEMLISNQNSSELSDAYAEGNISKVFEMLKVIIEKNRQKLFEEMGIDEARELLKKDPSDILYYYRVNAYFETYTQFNLVREKFYNMEDFLKILDYNNSLRHKLEEYINETNDYQLYWRYLKIWEDKFTVAQNVDVFGNAETFEDYLTSKDTNLIDYITMPQSVKNDRKKLNQWYDTTIYELCESLDMFINDPDNNHFIENSFIGISDFIKRYIMVAIIVFKAYTIDLMGSNSVLQYFDPTFNTIRLFDELMSITVEDVMTDNIYLEDLFAITSRENMESTLFLKDEIKIHLVNYQFIMTELPDGSVQDVPVKDANGNYVIADDTITQIITNNTKYM